MKQQFESFFRRLAGLGHDDHPHDWQIELGRQEAAESRLIRIPTGFGKTLGVLGAWAWNRLYRADDRWPRRLVWCLPMRVLVEQVAAEAETALSRLGCLWDGISNHAGKVGVHLLMGGEDSEAWHLHPEESAVLIGTQDMLLSRALNRGYGASRAHWPIDFGLLNHDCLWVMDEVQLMDVGLATSAQLQWFRAQDGTKGLRPCLTWWMSATLQAGWLESVDTRSFVATLPRTEIPAELRRGPLWESAAKPCHLQQAVNTKDWPGIVATAWRKHGRGRLTLVIVNTVTKACELHAQLERQLAKELPAQHLHLVHSRFRPAERTAWRDTFLKCDAVVPAEGRIVVATQVVEAGVDIDAALLVSELAPWPSLVQRFGRAARRGGTAQVIVLDCLPVESTEDDKRAANASLPYSVQELVAAREMLGRIPDVAPRLLDLEEESLQPSAIERLYPYSPRHLLLRNEWDELFDTTPDLSGADLDISRFIRSGDERDLQVFWTDVSNDDSPGDGVQSSRNALCSVPFLVARDWLCGSGKSERLAENRRAWIWDWLDGKWRKARRSDLIPGRIVLVAADSGGYDLKRGFDPRSPSPVATVPPVAAPAEAAADRAQDGEPLSAYRWRTIATHGREAAAVAQQIATTLKLAPAVSGLLALAARWHDYGKAHPAFQGSIRLSSERPDRQDLAKAPPEAWHRHYLYRYADGTDHRPGFRHELASTLALFSILARYRTQHPALLGPWAEVLTALGEPPPEDRSASPPTAVEQEVVGLKPEDFDLLAYLVASHHGKVRARLHAAPADQEYADRDGRGLPIRGVRDGDIVPAVAMSDSEAVPSIMLTLEPAYAGLSNITGASWSERVQGLLGQHGPAALAYLEALLRAADIRASRDTSGADPLLDRKGGQ